MLILLLAKASGRAKGGGGGGRGGKPLQGWQFLSQMYFYYTNRRAAQGGNVPCSATNQSIMYDEIKKNREINPKTLIHVKQTYFT